MWHGIRNCWKALGLPQTWPVQPVMSCVQWPSAIIVEGSEVLIPFAQTSTERGRQLGTYVTVISIRERGERETVAGSCFLKPANDDVWVPGQFGEPFAEAGARPCGRVETPLRRKCQVVGPYPCIRRAVLCPWRTVHWEQPSGHSGAASHPLCKGCPVGDHSWRFGATG